MDCIQTIIAPTISHGLTGDSNVNTCRLLGVKSGQCARKQRFSTFRVWMSGVIRHIDVGTELGFKNAPDPV
jgi:hypothetical protein